MQARKLANLMAGWKGKQMADHWGALTGHEKEDQKAKLMAAEMESQMVDEMASQ